MFVIVTLSANVVMYLVIFCRPFIQLLGNLEELKGKIYDGTAGESSDLDKQDHKIGRVPKLQK
jgi:hypothetical protein